MHRRAQPPNSSVAGAPANLYSAFASTAPGLAPVVAAELSALGLTVTETTDAGVAFDADLRALTVANLQLRTASRVVVRVDEFRAATFHELQTRTARIAWDRWLAPNRDVVLRVTCRKSRLYHSGAVAERVAASLAPFAGRVGTSGRSEGDDDDGTGGEAQGSGAPDDGDLPQLLLVRIVHDRCTISLDSSGALLHRRGYRRAVARAPLRETLGAALLLASGWQPGTPLLDPFCGAGTLAIEGAMLARRMAPGRARAFAFERWPRIDLEVVTQVRREARAGERPSAGAAIIASDRDAGAVEAARANAVRAGVDGDITFAVRAVSALELPEGQPGLGAIVTNPPYGVRVGEKDGLRDLYARTGAVLRARCAGWRLAVVSADARLVGQLGIALEERLRTNNGGLRVAFAVGEVPAGAERR